MCTTGPEHQTSVQRLWLEATESAEVEVARWKPEASAACSEDCGLSLERHKVDGVTRHLPDPESLKLVLLSAEQRG